MGAPTGARRESGRSRPAGIARRPRPIAGADRDPDSSVAVRLRSSAWRIVGGYFVVATLWILFSDRALGLLVDDPEQLVRFGSLKGLAFVSVTALLLLVVVRRSFASAAAAYDELEGHERELQRLGRLHDALLRMNQAVLHRSDADDLFAGACRALVESGGFGMAWIGRHDTFANALVPLARWGDDGGYLDEITVHTDERYGGPGPSGMALRDGRPYVCNQVSTDPAMDPWRDHAGRHGLEAMAVLPFSVRGEVWGVLVVYADEPGYFGADEVELLDEAAADIGYAFENLLGELERAEAEAEARRERQFSATMIDSMPGIVYFYDMAGRFLRWNRNFEEVSGWSGDELAEKHPIDFFAGADRDLVAARIAEVFERGESSVEADFVSRDGTTTPYFFTGRRVEYDSRTCLVGVGIDISERVRAERELRELNETLEQKVVERTDELSTALERAEVADRLKSAFLATMSHELRTPLNSIIGFTGIVLQGLAGPLSDEQATQLGMVRSSARHLLALINDVLDISKIEAGQLEIRSETFELDESIERVCGTIRPMLDGKGLALEVEVADDLGAMVGDQRRVEQILLNLLTNAVKFTDEGTVALTVDLVDEAPVDAEVHADAGADVRAHVRPGPVPSVRIRVCDTGIGIADTDLRQLFQPFRQVDTGLSRGHDGTGLGLAICRRLADLMGGRIVATSAPGSGSEFTVVLPLGRVAA